MDTLRLLFAPLVLTGVILIGTAAQGQWVERTDYQLCVEVEEMVNENVEYGLLTQKEADAIANRCFNTFVK